MSTPTVYTRQRDYSQYQADNPDTELNGADLDSDFDGVKTALDSLRTCLATIRRDDGALKNGSVDVDQLSSAVVLLMSGFTPRGDWVTSTAYAVGDVVRQSNATYACLVAHTSGTFATDLAAAKWMVLSNLASAASVSVTPTGSIASTTVQDALAELDTEKQPLDATLTALAGASTGANKIPYFSGTDTVAVADFTAAARTLLALTTAAAMLSNLGGVAKAGDTMTGALTLSGAPTSSLHAASKAYVDASSSALRGYIAGLTLSTAGSSTTFSVAAGVATDSTHAEQIRLESAISKTTSAWAVGTGNGALDTGAIANNTGYHVWLIKRSDTGVVDVLISTSASSPTMPASYDYKRRIGWMRTNGSAQWTAFVQNGDQFKWVTWSYDYSGASGSTSRQNLTLNVPTGVIVFPMVIAQNATGAGGGDYLLLTSLDETDAAPAVGKMHCYAGGTAGTRGNPAEVTSLHTDTSGRIGRRSFAADAGVDIHTMGWVDTRGRFG